MLIHHNVDVEVRGKRKLIFCWYKVWVKKEREKKDGKRYEDRNKMRGFLKKENGGKRWI